MAMDWSGYGDYAGPPMEDIDDEEEDFYSEQNHMNGNDHMQTAAGASAHAQSYTNTLADTSAMLSNNNASLTLSAEEQRKHEQQKQLEALRKKLLAKRGTGARPDTPSKALASPEAPPPEHRIEQQENNAAVRTVNQHINDDFGIESLLAEGKAAAEAKVARDNKAAAAAVLAATMNQPANVNHQPAAAAVPTKMEVDKVKPDTLQEKPAEPTQPVISATQKSADTKQSNTVPNPQGVNMSDPYYDDVAIWLEFTGYHDVQFRDTKLGNYRRRRKLEQQAAEIAQQLEKLKQADEATVESTRANPAHPTIAAPMAPPPLPANMLAGDHRNGNNGLKRPHSPDPPRIEKSSRKTNEPVGDFRIRGANEAGAAFPRDNGSPLQRRGSLPERRRSINERHERDPSLERRQQHYNRDPPTPRANGRGGHNQWGPARDGPRPFNARDRERERERDDRAGFSAVNRVSGPAQGGNSGLDLRKGGIRYFMIKSWNHDNVAQAMKDSLWATQEKNQSLLTEAFHSSRHVILLFSVNRSMAFQGYALMTSPPDPSLPMPTFCNKLNWATSPAFSLQWLATTPVHFRLVGHLKNTCNPDEEGVPRAVLVGKDGQEISQDAGMGVVWILDEADEVEGRGRLREERE